MATRTLKKFLDCPRDYGETMFLWLPETLWTAIDCSPTDYLCAHCIINCLQKINNVFYIINAYGESEVKATGVVIEMKDSDEKNNRAKISLAPEKCEDR